MSKDLLTRLLTFCRMPSVTLTAPQIVARTISPVPVAWALQLATGPAFLLLWTKTKNNKPYRECVWHPYWQSLYRLPLSW
jgi:hypothetical protein